MSDTPDTDALMALIDAYAKAVEAHVQRICLGPEHDDAERDCAEQRVTEDAYRAARAAVVEALRSKGEPRPLLSDEKIAELWANSNPTRFEAVSFARAVEAAVLARVGHPEDGWWAGTEDCEGNPLVTLRSDAVLAAVEFMRSVALASIRLDGDMVRREELAARLARAAQQQRSSNQ